VNIRICNENTYILSLVSYYVDTQYVADSRERHNNCFYKYTSHSYHRVR